MRQVPSRILAVGLLLVLLLAGCSRQARFEHARSLLERGRAANALDAFQSLLTGSSGANVSEQTSLWFEIGECLRVLSRFGEAFSAYERAVELDPNNSAARLRLGEIYLAEGASPMAAEQARKALQHSGPSADAFELLGAAASEQNETATAIEALRKALALDSKRIKAAVLLAELLQRDGKGQQAREVLWRAAFDDPHSAAPFLALADIAEQDARQDEAEDAYRRAVDVENTPATNRRLVAFLVRSQRPAEARKVLRALDEKGAGMPPALADFDLNSGHSADAVRQYAARLEQDPSVDGKPNSRIALIARLVEAEIQLPIHPNASERVGGPAQPGKSSGGNLQLARARLEQFASELDEGTAHLLRAEIELAGGDLSVASEEVDKALEAVPDSPAAHYLAGVLRERLQDLPGARNEWEAAIRANLDYVPARLALASLLLGAGQNAEAEEAILPVVRAEPENVQALVLFCRALQASGKYGMAEVIADRVEPFSKRSPQASLLRGEIAVARRRPGAALLYYEQALILDPHSDEAMRGLVRVYRTGSVDRPMLLKMEMLAASDQGLAGLMELVGTLFAERGWRTDALRCFRQAAAMDPARSSAFLAGAKLLAHGGQMSAAAESAAKVEGLANLLAALSAEQQDNLSEAVRNYEAAVRGGDTSGISANNLAWIYARQGRELDRALSLANFARQVQPENPAVLDTVGAVYLARREYTAAVGVLELAQKLARSPRRQGSAATDLEVAAQIGRDLALAYRSIGLAGAE